MEITLIAAVAQNGTIGSKNGGIPWHLPRDTARFRSYCDGKTLLMGRKTYGEMIGWFWNQRVLMLSHHSITPSLEKPSVEIIPVTSLSEAISQAKEWHVPELVVIGGGNVFEQTLPLATRLVLTLVHTEVEGAATFPAWTGGDWREIERTENPPDEANCFAMTFLVLKKGA